MISMKYEAILFDMDGVIIDTHLCAYSVLSESALRYGIEITPKQIMALGSLSGRQFWTMIKDEYGLSESAEKLVNQYDFDREMSFYEKIGLMPDVESVMSEIKSTGRQVGLVTSAKPIRTAKVLSLFENPELFDLVITADDVQEHKPSPQCYLFALEKMQIESLKVLVVEDSSNGAKAARNAGCDVVGFKGSMWEHDSFEANEYIHEHKQLLPICIR